MIHYWKGLELETTDFENHYDPTPPQVKLYHQKPTSLI